MLRVQGGQLRTLGTKTDGLGFKNSTTPTLNLFIIMMLTPTAFAGEGKLDPPTFGNSWAKASLAFAHEWFKVGVFSALKRSWWACLCPRTGL